MSMKKFVLLSKPSFYVVALLLAFSLVLGACNGGEAGVEDAETVSEEVSEEAVTEESETEGEVVETAEITETEAITPTEEMTTEETVTDSDTMTETDNLTETDPLTGTDVLTETEVLTEGSTTNEMDLTGLAETENLMLSASALLDYDFENLDGAVSGEIEDLLIDTTNGRILFATLEYGGFLDIGDTHLPVPLNAFAWGPDGELVLNFPEESLNNFPSLGENWPDLADPAWDDDVLGFWNDIGIDPGFDFEEGTSTVLPASEIVGYPVADVGAGVGTVQDMLIDLTQNRVKYVILTYGIGAAGDDYIPVPFSAFDVEGFGDEFVLNADLDAETLAASPDFDETLFFDVTDPIAPTIDDEIDTYWQELGYTFE
jgi:sporulation protein YlmC with PRC-barrel domain